MNEFEETNALVKPLIMIVEDREDGRRDVAELLKQLGCAVITAENANEALKNYMITPRLDLVFTDIDLLGSENYKDKSGVDIARFIKQLNSKLPVIGYSSKFEDNELTDEERSYFNGWYFKGGMSVQALSHMYVELKSKADQHKKGRFDDIADAFNILKQKNVIDLNHFSEVLELAISYGTAPSLQIEEAASEKGYELKLVDPKTINPIAKPFLIWTRSEKNIHEIEVYGYSELYSFGQTEKEALAKLLELMRGFASDMKKESPENFAGPALRLRKFLFNILK